MQLYRVEGLTQVADAYGAGTFGSCDYNSSTCASSAGNTGGLANTGVMVIGVATLACLIILMAILVRVWRRPAKPATEEVAAVDVEAEAETADVHSPSSTDRQI
ncbi:MAG TPA: hypothetical protein VLI54_02520 [Bacillota bacterium]|nr:hypothetical protein [Bacillota bacterium]